MKVFLVKGDVSEFQSIGLIDESLWASDNFTFDCFAKADWKPVKCYVHNPKLPRGNFLHLSPGLLVFDQQALEGMQDIFEMAGEILPFELENGDKLFGINIKECVNAIDMENSQWKISRSGVKTYLKHYVFHSNRFSESTLFKVPETSRGSVLCYDGFKDKTDEFKGRYEELGLTGLVFKELWRAPTDSFE